VSVEVPAPAAGVLSEIVAAAGTTVEAGGKLAVLAPSGSTPTAAPKAAAPTAAPTPTGKDVEDAPSAKKLMAENNLSRDQVAGSGKDGRVMKEDVQKALTSPTPAAEAPAPAVPRAPVAAEDAGREERVKMTRLRQTIARRLKDAQNTAAMLTTYNEVDMSAVMGLRKEYKELFEKKHGVKLGFMSFFTKACCHALKEVPEVNAEVAPFNIIGRWNFCVWMRFHGHLQIHQQPPRVFQCVFHTHQKRHRPFSIHNPVVIGQRQVHHWADHNLAADDNGALFDFVHPQNAGLRWVQNG